MLSVAAVTCYCYRCLILLANDFQSLSNAVKLTIWENEVIRNYSIYSKAH